MPSTAATLTNYGHITEAELDEWVEQFHRDGYLFLPEYLTAEFAEELRQDLMRALDDPACRSSSGNPDPPDAKLRLRVCMFERSPANLRLFDLDPIARFAEKLVAENCHVIHNNSFITMRGGGISGWHQDDASHMIVTHGEPPTNIRLPVLFFTANYYLTDVTDKAIGGTEVIPGSHLFGGSPPSGDLTGTKYEPLIRPCLGKAGSVTMFNNQVWHRGGPNQSDSIRAITQITYGRRLINSMYYPFMNYQMPEHIYKDADPRLKRLLGFLPHGAYG